MPSLVGSEMCIRDRVNTYIEKPVAPKAKKQGISLVSGKGTFFTKITKIKNIDAATYLNTLNPNGE